MGYQLEAPPDELETTENEGQQSPKAIRMASVDSIRTKQRAWIDDAYETMKRFEHFSPRENMQRLAAISAYASELRGQLTRRPEPELNQLRIKEVDPLLKEVDRQFKIWSRYQAAMEHDWEIERGGM